MNLDESPMRFIYAFGAAVRMMTDEERKEFRKAATVELRASHRFRHAVRTIIDMYTPGMGHGDEGAFPEDIDF